MFNKSNLFHKTADTPVTRTTPRPTGNSGTTSSVLAAAEPVSAGTPAASTEVSSKAETAATESTAPVSASEATSESRLIVGPDVKLKGAEILDCDTLVVEGRVEATMDSRVIRIAENGSFTGKVSIDVAEIHGSFEGELTARKQLIVHTTGRVSGKIRYGKLVIDEGGELRGDVNTLGEKAAAYKATPETMPPLAAVGT